MTQFSLTTIWLIEAPLEAICDAIYESERWPTWWPYVVRVQESALAHALTLLLVVRCEDHSNRALEAAGRLSR